MWTVPLPATLRRHPDLGFPRHGSISVGTIATGHLVAGRRLEFEEPNLRVMPEHRTRGTNYGTDELVATIAHAAAAVAEAAPGALLSVGNLSKGGGGDIPWSISHNSGRDADLGFYMIDDHGQPVLLPSLLPLTPPDGSVELEGRVVRFDVARNWLLVKDLLTRPDGRVQYVFCARFLIRRMLEHAAALGEDARWLKSLDPVLRQPKGTASHNDHFHVRVMCSPDDAADGCRDLVQGEEIIARSLPGYKQRVRAALETLENDHATTRAEDALGMLTILGWGVPRDTLLAVLEDCQEPVCAKALRLAESRGMKPPAALLERLLSRTDSPGSMASAFRILRRLDPEEATAMAVSRLTDRRELVEPGPVFDTREVVRAHAALVLGWTARRKDVPVLLPLLSDPSRDVRWAALWSIRALSAGEVFPDSVLDSPATDMAAQWEAFLDSHRSVDGTFRRELNAHGYRVKALTRDAVIPLLAAVKDPRDYISLHAQKALRKILDVKQPINIRDKDLSHWEWRGVVEEATGGNTGQRRP
jgi:murein endopeptidase